MVAGNQRAVRGFDRDKTLHREPPNNRRSRRVWKTPHPARGRRRRGFRVRAALLRHAAVRFLGMARLGFAPARLSAGTKQVVNRMKQSQRSSVIFVAFCSELTSALRTYCCLSSLEGRFFGSSASADKPPERLLTEQAYPRRDVLGCSRSEKNVRKKPR